MKTDALTNATVKAAIEALQSGDREDPLDKITQGLNVGPVHNRIYAIRDYNFRFGPPAKRHVHT